MRHGLFKMCEVPVTKIRDMEMRTRQTLENVLDGKIPIKCMKQCKTGTNC